MEGICRGNLGRYKESHSSAPLSVSTCQPYTLLNLGKNWKTALKQQRQAKKYSSHISVRSFIRLPRTSAHSKPPPLSLYTISNTRGKTTEETSYTQRYVPKGRKRKPLPHFYSKSRMGSYRHTETNRIEKQRQDFTICFLRIVKQVNLSILSSNISVKTLIKGYTKIILFQVPLYLALVRLL